MTPAILLNLLVVAFFLALAPVLPTKKTWSRTIVVAVGLILACRYMWWRLTVTLLPVDPATPGWHWFWFIYLVECAAFITYTLHYITLTRITDWSAHADRYEARLRTLPASQLPTVDVFIPTYNEGLDVLERTIVGALGLDYPRFTVWVLDDGKRDWLKDYCERRGVQYVRRPNNAHAKAGNINNALGISHGELFAVFDADFVPHRDFLYRTIGFFFADPSIAIVQTPQHFFNSDPFQHNLGLANSWTDDQRQWYDEILPARDAWDAAFCCGSSSIQRRDLVMAAGGIPTESVTEDIMLTLVLLRQGYVTRYLNERLSMGLAPEGLTSYVIQRRRWCRGHLQALFLKMGPLGSGLTLTHRLLFFPWDWLVQLPVRLTPLLIPLVHLWLGIAPFPMPGMGNLLYFQFPLFVAFLGLSRWFGRNSVLPLVTGAQGLFATLRVFPTIFATLYKPFGTPFKVTPKGSSSTFIIDRVALVFALVVFGLLGIGLVINWSCYDRADDLPELVYASIWALGSMVVTGILALIALEKPRPRIEERFAVNEQAVCRADAADYPCSVVDLSVSGAQLQGNMPLAEGEEFELELEHFGVVPARVVRRDGARTGVQFADAAEGARDGLIRYLYTTGRTNQVRHLRPRQLLRNLLVRAFGP